LISKNIAIQKIISPLKSNISNSEIYIIQGASDKISLNYHSDNTIQQIMTDTSVIGLINCPLEIIKIDNKIINQPNLQSSTTYFAWDPVNKSNTYVRFFTHADLPKYQALYKNIVQGKQLITNEKTIAVSEPRYSSISAIGLDKYNNLIFVHSRTPYSLNQLSSIINEVMPGIKHLILTGVGPTSILSFRGEGQPFYSIGSYQTSVFEADTNASFPKTTVITMKEK
jgi:hypothetical protein